MGRFFSRKYNINHLFKISQTQVGFRRMSITNNVINDSTQQNGGQAFVGRNVKVWTSISDQLRTVQISDSEANFS